MEKRELKIGDVLQINPDGKYKDTFGGFLIVCEEPKSWGCQGYILAPHDFNAVRFKGWAYLRPRFEDMEYVGHLPWMGYQKDDPSISDETDGSFDSNKKPIFS